MNPWPIVVADLRRTRAGALAIVLLIALATALGVAVSAQERALRQGSARAADGFDLLIGAPGSETQLMLSAVYLQPAAIDLIAPEVLGELAANPEVAWVSPIGFGDNYRGYPIVGVTAEFVTDAGARPLAEGRPFERIDEVVVGAAVDLAIGASFVPVHGLVEAAAGEAHGGFTYRVVGRMPRLGTPWDRAIVTPIESVWWVHALPVGHALDEAALFPAGGVEPDLGAVPIGPPWEPAELTGVPAIVVGPSSFAAAYQLRQAYRNRPDTMAVFPAEVLVRLYGLLGDVRDLLAVISVLTQTLVVGAVLLAVVASLAMRRRVIAVLRALGASRAFVFATVWLNVSLLLTAGAALGLALGWAAAWLLSRAFAARTDIDLAVAVSRQEISLVLALVLVGVALATVPATLAYRGSVSAGLRAA